MEAGAQVIINSLLQSGCISVFTEVLGLTRRHSHAGQTSEHHSVASAWSLLTKVDKCDMHTQSPVMIKDHMSCIRNA